MASMDPSEEEIAQVIEFASLNPVDDRSMAIQALKNNDRNVETVVTQYFDDPESFRQRYTWDDTMFTSDREGTGNNAGISFHIESPSQNDAIQGATPPPAGYAPGAPSRPPSPSGRRSPLTRMADWAMGDSSVQTQEDEDMQRALRESAQIAGIAVPQQESGVVSGTTPSPYFGPANRNDYSQNEWAMVPTGATQEAWLDSDPPPSKRQRAAGAPALLVQGANMTGTNLLGGLLTILHQIPLARNTLLACGEPASSYGHNSEWWKGQEILPPHVLAQIQAGELQWGAQEAAKPNFEEEIHRLMAFLDQTERSYGTVSVLTNIMPYQNAGAEKQFYEHLAERNREKLAPLTQIATVVEVHPFGAGADEAKFGLMDLEHTRAEYTWIKTLYEAIDFVMWSDAISFTDIQEGSKMAMFKDTGEIFAVRIGGEGPAVSIDIPEVFYPERWLESRKEEAMQIQARLVQAKAWLTGNSTEEHDVQKWHDERSKKINDDKISIKKAIDQWSSYVLYLEGLGRFQAMEESGFDAKKFPDYTLAPRRLNEEQEGRLEKVTESLRWANNTLSDLEERSKALEARMDRLRAKQHFLGKLLTQPDKPGLQKPFSCKKYLLRGVATPNDTVYVCQRAEPDLIDLDDVAPPADQWWRLSYSPNDAEPVKAEKVEVERVLRDVWLETKTPLLIYATEDALNAHNTPLNSALERFVRADNKAFRQELNAEKTEVVELRRRSLEPLSPSKRKHRADSMDSMDSNRASLGSVHMSDGDNPFADQDIGHATELMDLTTAMSGGVGSDQPQSNSGPGTGTGLPPSYSQAMADTSSATLTPATLVSEDLDVGGAAAARETQAPAVSQHEDHGSSDISGPAQESRGPEMQERARPPGLFTSSSGTNERNGNVGTMNMDLPDHQG